jgi:hypothetical protein
MKGSTSCKSKKKELKNLLFQKVLIKYKILSFCFDVEKSAMASYASDTAQAIRIY